MKRNRAAALLAALAIGASTLFATGTALAQPYPNLSLIHI